MSLKHALHVIAGSLLIMQLGVVAGPVHSVHFKTTAPPSIFVVPQNLKPYEPMFRTGLTSLPESILVNGALTLGGQSLGLTGQEATNLNSLLVTTYSQIKSDSALSNLPSALPYCFSSQRHTNGHYFISLPENLTDQSPVIAFLHGYGGNFQFYLWALRTSLPEAVIICPSWNGSWYGGSPRYLMESIEDAKQRFHFKSTNQWLMGISAGGRAGFAIYPQVASAFEGYICLGSAPESSNIYHFKRESRILMINGSRDPMVPMDFVRRQVALLKRQVPSARLEELASDHFFILGQREQCFRLVQQFYQSRDK